MLSIKFPFMFKIKIKTICNKNGFKHMISCIYIFVRNISQLGILTKLLTLLFPSDIN